MSRKRYKYLDKNVEILESLRIGDLILWLEDDGKVFDVSLILRIGEQNRVFKLKEKNWLMSSSDGQHTFGFEEMKKMLDHNYIKVKRGKEYVEL